MIGTAIWRRTQYCSGFKAASDLSYTKPQSQVLFAIRKYALQYLSQNKIYIFGVNCSIKLVQVGRIFFLFLNFFYHYFFSIQRAYGTLNQNLLKFLNTLKSLTKLLNQLDHIKWFRDCVNLWLFGRQTEGIAVPKET